MSLIELSALWKSPSISAGRVLERASERANVWTIAVSPFLVSSVLLPGYHVAGSVAGTPHLQAVERAGILAADLAGQRLGQVPDQRLLRVGGVDAREVAGVHQHVVRPQLLDRFDELAWVALGRVQRQDRHPEMLADVLRRRALHPRHQPAEVLPLLVEAPHVGRQPGEARLQQRYFQARAAVEDALA